MDFVAIDFETANNYQHTAVCAVGVAEVCDGHILCPEGWLVKPPVGTIWDKRNERVNKITEKDVADAGDWSEIWEDIGRSFRSWNVVAHGMMTFDKHKLEALGELYEISTMEFTYFDTFQVTHKSLGESCREYGIPFDESCHHGAMYDAEKCAELTLAILAKNPNAFDIQPKKKSQSKKLTSSHLGHIEVVNKDSIFFGKTVAYSGEFVSMSRDDVAIKLHSLGAKVTSGISSKTDIFVCGYEAGQLDKLKTQKENGHNIIVLTEAELLEYLPKLD